MFKAKILSLGFLSSFLLILGLSGCGPEIEFYNPQFNGPTRIESNSFAPYSFSIGVDVYDYYSYEDCYYYDDSYLDLKSEVELIDKPVASNPTLIPFTPRRGALANWVFYPDQPGTYTLKTRVHGYASSCGYSSSRSHEEFLTIEAIPPAVGPRLLIDQFYNQGSPVSSNLYSMIPRDRSLKISNVSPFSPNHPEEVEFQVVFPTPDANEGYYLLVGNGKTYRMPFYFGSKVPVFVAFADLDRDGIDEIYVAYGSRSHEDYYKPDGRLPLYMRMGIQN